MNKLFPPVVEPGVKNKALLVIILASVSLVGILVSLCGIGLSLGMRKLSLVSFFSVMVLLVLLRMIGSRMDKKKEG